MSDDYCAHHDDGDGACTCTPQRIMARMERAKAAEAAKVGIPAARAVLEAHRPEGHTRLKRRHKSTEGMKRQ